MQCGGLDISSRRSELFVGFEPEVKRGRLIDDESDENELAAWHQ